MTRCQTLKESGAQAIAEKVALLATLCWIKYFQNEKLFVPQREIIFSSIFPLVPLKPEEEKSQYKIWEVISCLEEDFWTLGKTWGWAVGGPGWDCSYETGGESHASTLQKIIFTIRLRVSLEMTKPLKSSWGTKKEKSSSGSTLRWNITFYKSNWFLQHIFYLGFYFDEQAIFSDILFTQRCLFRSIWSLSCLFSV